MATMMPLQRRNTTKRHALLLAAALMVAAAAAAAATTVDSGAIRTEDVEQLLEKHHDASVHVVGTSDAKEEEIVFEGDWEGGEDEEGEEEEGEWDEEEDGDWEEGDEDENEEEADGEYWDEEGEWDEEEVEGNGWLPEEERLIEYNKRNYTWPLPHYVPNTPGWKTLMDERFRQVSQVQDKYERYEGYVQTINSAFMVPNFTEHGFGLARAPADLMVDLRQAIHDGLPTAGYEGHTNEIDAPLQCLFIENPELTERVLHELQPYAEAWSGVELTPFRAYGFRLYQNQSQLTMHVDRMQTHIISFILHIDSSEDADPWPIFIEDLHGRTHEVLLTTGDILFYESSKCFHGRPQRLNGSWYSSIFVHYYPADGWQDTDHDFEAHCAVPPVWVEEPTSGDNESNNNHKDRLEMVGAGMRHPDCPNAWCPTKNSVKWGGPGEDGYWIDPVGVRHEFNPKPAASRSAQHEEL